MGKKVEVLTGCSLSGLISSLSQHTIRYHVKLNKYLQAARPPTSAILRVTSILGDSTLTDWHFTTCGLFWIFSCY